MKPPPEHVHFLQQVTEVPESVAIGFTAEEVQSLRNYACWCNALIGYRLRAYTQAQQHFISVATSRSEANSEFEALWLRYQASLHEFEKVEDAAREQRAALC